MYLIHVNKWMEMQTNEWKQWALKNRKKAKLTECISCFASVSLLSSAGSQFVTEDIYLLHFLTGRQSCYAMNRFLYILITSTSWCWRGRLQICSPSGLISFYPQILAAAASHTHENGISVKCCTFALASLSAITKTATIPLLLLCLLLPPIEVEADFLTSNNKLHENIYSRRFIIILAPNVNKSDVKMTL